MGMSQEDIEALMGGIELPQNESKQDIEDLNKQVDTDEIEALFNKAS